jgi:exopolysaccharide biosynthesis polyprenyl glycosylphosphotransferase
MTVVNVLTSERRSQLAAGEGHERRAVGPHVRFLILADGAAALAAALFAHAWHDGGSDAGALSGTPARLGVALMAPGWIAALWLRRAYDRRFAGSETYRRTLRTAGVLVGLSAVSALIVDSTALFRQAVIAISLAALLTPVSRRLAALRPSGAHLGRHVRRRALLVGHPKSVTDFFAAVRPGKAPALHIVGACLVGPVEPVDIESCPVDILGDLDTAAEAAQKADCELVILLACPELDGAALRALSWKLHDAGMGVQFAPLLTAVAEERIRVGNVDGVPLFHIRAPILSGPLRLLKDLVDRAVAAVLLVALAPVLLALMAVVRATSPGPALFRQRRVGRGGREFTCLKLRTMVVDAEKLQGRLDHLNENQDGLLFKIRDDPRLTPAGPLLRKYSLDELPQLLNVLAGSMSLVGPRPPLPSEVARYSEEVRRRLRVKPGLTGLWQVSGRSSLSWVDSVRLDLGYVENWSPRLDAEILLRTTSAVVRGTGAY